MSNSQDVFGDYVNKYPRQTIFLIVFALFLSWQIFATLIGFSAYLFTKRFPKLKGWWVFSFGFSIACTAFLFQVDAFSENSLWNIEIIKEGFLCNFSIFLFVLHGDFLSATTLLFNDDFYYFWGTLFLYTGISAIINLIPNSAHEEALLALQEARLLTTQLVSQKRIDKALKALEDCSHGIALGVSKKTAKPVFIPSFYVNQIVMALGTTGSGKTVTLQRFYSYVTKEGWPLVIIDGKPTLENIERVKTLAVKHQRQFYIFNSHPFHHYDCLAHGGYTELKDKIISLKDEWSSDYYLSIAEDYLQTTFEVLLKLGEPFDLKKIVDCLSIDELAALVRETEDKRLVERVSRLANYEQKDITGLQAHLSILVNSELGDFFEINDQTFSLLQAMKDGAIVYFALPALKFPSFAKVLGKLVINDIKTVIGSDDWHQKIFAVFDEFSVFAGDQVLNLVNMGRGKGLHAIFGTQGLADLKQISPAFESQVLNCVNTLICHRLNDQESAESVAIWAGTQDTFDVTAQVTSSQSSDSMGSVRKNKSFIVHPDDIKQSLAPGEAFYITKVDGFKIDKVQVKFS